MLFKILACVAILTLIIKNRIYKMQIKNIHRQVDFIREYETNKIITQSGNDREINKLVNKLNELITIQRNETKQYKSKDEILKETITNISHDIRTPLTSLNGYFQLLIETDSEEEKERYITIIQTRINNLKNLLEDMFTYMKIQDNNYKIHQEDCNINKIVQDNLFSYYEDFKSKEIEPNINIPENPMTICGNVVALNRIVNNLINNSLIHGKSYIGVRLFKEDNHIKLIVENDIESEKSIDLENIFTRFYKNDKARTVNSTGLGLTIVKELVEAMDGKIIANIDDNIFSISIYLTNIK